MIFNNIFINVYVVRDIKICRTGHVWKNAQKPILRTSKIFEKDIIQVSWITLMFLSYKFWVFHNRVP